MKILSRFLHLSWSERYCVVKVTFLIVTTKAGLMVLPFRVVQQWIKRFSGKKVDPAAYGDGHRELLVWSVRAIGRRLLGKRPCLPQALVLQLLFERRGYPATMHIGVAKDKENRLIAHAWVESDGKIVIGGDQAAVQYVALRPIECSL